ncbi:nucleotidyltransferase family protein [Paracoccus sp. (in: a-proteobacteria)]|uniref:nucleotidyltransferase family protein n=1 Tax=Paracoccus sp. TaxID=267 RepID=UPI00396C6105
MAGSFQTGPEVAGDGAAEIAVLMAASDPGQQPQLAVTPEVVVPERLFHLARYNKMLGWLPLAPQALPAGCQGLSADLLQANLKTVALNRLAMAVSTEVSGTLAGHGLAHVVMKGPFQQMVVHDQPFKRPSGDIDLFVRPRDRAQAAKVLKQMGFVPMEPDRALWWISFLGEEHFLRPSDNAVIDLHHSLQQVGLPDWRHASEVLDRVISLSHQGTQVPVPAPEDGCLLLTITIAKALLAREPCGWAVADLARWLDRLTAPEWQRLVQIASRSGQRQTLRLGLTLVSAFYGPPQPTDDDAAAAMQAVLEGPVSKARHMPGLSHRQIDLQNMVFQPWHNPSLAPRRRDMLRMLSLGRPHVLAGQGLRAALSPLVLAWLRRGEGKSDQA